MDEKQLQQKYERLQGLNKHMQTLNKQLSSLEEKSSEIQDIKDALEDLKDCKVGDEVLVPLNNGIFLKAQITDLEKLKVNVGSNTVVDKSIADTKELVQSQQNEIESYKTNVMQQMTQIDEQAYSIEKEMKEELKDE